VTAEALRAKIDWNRRFVRGGSVSAKFSRERDVPHQSFFTRIDTPMNALQLCRWQFLHKEIL